MTKAEQSLETRDRILDVSRELFAAHGYEATGVALICETAGVSKGAFYHHFPRKQAVLEAIFSNWLGSLEASLDLWKDEAQPAPETLLAAAAAAAPAFSGADRSRRLLLELWSQAARDADLAAVARAPYHHYTDGLKTVLDRGVRQASLRRHDTTTASRVLISLAVGALLQSLIEPADVDWGRIVAAGVSMLLRGIGKET
jgi:AcrR family transcriptional regulator